MVYPSDGLAIADAPLGCVDRGDSARRQLFQDLKAHLMSQPVQQELRAMGRRTGQVGAEQGAGDAAVFRPEWGAATARFTNQIRYPKPDVIREALELYQTALRKPSCTVYCLDFSGSMQGPREEGVKSAMRLLLDQDQARRAMLQAAPADITVVLPFSNSFLGEWKAAGNNAGSLRELWSRIDRLRPAGGTDIYSPAIRAMELMQEKGDLEDYAAAVILLTDGESNVGRTLTDLTDYINSHPRARQIPVYSIRFGEASEHQLEAIADLTSGRVFDGQADLARAFRDAEGYN
jgi:Ca-activated chloride channel family protein